MEVKRKNDKESSFIKFVEENQFKLPKDYKFVREELYKRHNQIIEEKLKIENPL